MMDKRMEQAINAITVEYNDAPETKAMHALVKRISEDLPVSHSRMKDELVQYVMHAEAMMNKMIKLTALTQVNYEVYVRTEKIREEKLKHWMMKYLNLLDQISESWPK